MIVTFLPSKRRLCFAPRGSNHSLYEGEQSGMGVSPSSFDLAPLALYSGRGAGGEGFTLCFDREFNL